MALHSNNSVCIPSLFNKCSIEPLIYTYKLHVTISVVLYNVPPPNADMYVHLKSILHYINYT